MKVTLRIPDHIWEKYEYMAESGQAASGKTFTVEELIVSQLERFGGIGVLDRIVIIDPKSRQHLENTLGGGSLKDAEDLIKKVEDFASINIGNIRLAFTPGQMKELKARASRNRRTTEELVRSTIKEMEYLFFNTVS